MTNKSAYATLVSFLKKELQDAVSRAGIHSVADELNLLPVGVEVLLANPWSIETTMEMAESLGYRISFEVH